MSEINADLLRDAITYADRWIGFQQRLKEIPAVTFAVRFEDESVLSAAYGQANLEDGTPVTPQHIFRVASHSKWFTATAIMQLKEAGKLRLDDAIGQSIPWLEGGLAAVTIRQTLNHAAGFTRDGYDNDHWQLEHDFPDGEQLRKLVEQGGEVVAPNRILKYSNIGFSLLGLVIEDAAGIPYNEYMQRNIVERLGLSSTGPETHGEAQRRMVRGYTSRSLLQPRFPLPDVSTFAMSPATGFYSTAEELTRFAAAHFFDNEELIGDESKREMQRAYWPVQDMDSYGLGVMISKIGERTLVGHGGGFPGHTTRTLVDPHDRFAISILTSETGGYAGTLATGVVKLINLALEGKPAEDAGALDRYAGRFASLWGFVDIVRLGDRLFTIPPSADDPAAFASKLEVIDAGTLKIEEKEGYGSPGEQIQYVRDDNGVIVKVVMAGATQYPEDTRSEYLQRRREELAATR